ncbi:MAG: hypothetical protein ACJ8C4_21400 [Gemmataceae bacterium]
MKLFAATLLALVTCACTISLAQSPTEPSGPAQTSFDLIDSANYQLHPCDSELQWLLKERVRVAVAELRAMLRVDIGRGTLTRRFEAGEHVKCARLALVCNPQEQLEILRQHLVYARHLVGVYRPILDAGNLREQNWHQILYHRIDCELQVALVIRQCWGCPYRPGPCDRIEIQIEAPNAEESPLRQWEDLPPIPLPELARVKPPTVLPTDDDVRRLLKERAACALREFRLRTQESFHGRGTYEDWHTAAENSRDSLLSLTSDCNQHLEILKLYRESQKAYQEYERRLSWNADMFWWFFDHIRYDWACSEIAVMIFEQRVANGGCVPALQTPFPAPDISGDINSNRENPEYPSPQFATAQQFTVGENEFDLRGYMKRRMNHALRETSGLFYQYRVGRGTLDGLIVAAQRARNARLAVTCDPAQRIVILTEYRDFLRNVEKLNQARFDVGGIRQEDLESSRYERLSAEIELLWAQGWR